MVLCMVPVAVLLNYMLYGAGLFNDVRMFAGTLVATFIFLTVFFNGCGFVAVQLRNRFPSEAELVKRILICLGIFYLMSALFISLVLIMYNSVGFFGYRYNEAHFYYAYLAAVVINTFITFLMEAIYRFEQLKETSVQTESLRKQYTQSKLLGLKSHVNPHFLFNSLNTLSSLIQEDADKAELFLNHLSKVYRYLLRYRDEQLVSLGTELTFIQSFYYLLKQRHGDGIMLHMDIPRSSMVHMIAPLTLQAILENSVNNNCVSKDAPLKILMYVQDDSLVICNSVQCKINTIVDNTLLENIARKYDLLCSRAVQVTENTIQRMISIPLIPDPQIVMA